MTFLCVKFARYFVLFSSIFFFLIFFLFKQLFASKYKCPRCMKRTCSAACVKVHKETLKCNGERDVVGFVLLKEFDDNQLMDDYNFLLRAKKAVENGKVCCRHLCLCVRVFFFFFKMKTGKFKGQTSSSCSWKKPKTWSRASCCSHQC